MRPSPAPNPKALRARIDCSPAASPCVEARPGTPPPLPAPAHPVVVHPVGSAPDWMLPPDDRPLLETIALLSSTLPATAPALHALAEAFATESHLLNGESFLRPPPAGLFAGLRRSWHEARASVLFDEIRTEIGYAARLPAREHLFYCRAVAHAWHQLWRTCATRQVSVSRLPAPDLSRYARTALAAARSVVASDHTAARGMGIVALWLEAHSLAWHNLAFTAAKDASTVIQEALHAYAAAAAV